MGKIGDKIKMSYFTEGEKRWIKRHTEKTFKKLGIDMKPSNNRAKMSNEDIKFWSDIFDKMGVLVDLMLACKPNHDIDDPEIRWVTDRIEYWQTDDRILTKNEMLTANLYWEKYGGSHNVKGSIR